MMVPLAATSTGAFKIEELLLKALLQLIVIITPAVKMISTSPKRKRGILACASGRCADLPCPGNIVAARVFATILRKFRQPSVVGEIAAGLILGPSCFGYFFPEVSWAFFGPSLAETFGVLSQHARHGGKEVDERIGNGQDLRRITPC